MILLGSTLTSATRWTEISLLAGLHLAIHTLLKMNLTLHSNRTERHVDCSQVVIKQVFL